MMLLLKYNFYFVEPKNVLFFMWQYSTGLELGPELESEPELEPKLNNFVCATLIIALHVLFTA